jgi:hypothetical protein
MVVRYNEPLRYGFCAEQLGTHGAPCFTLQIEDESLSRLVFDDNNDDDRIYSFKKMFGFKDFCGAINRGSRFGFDNALHVSETYGPGKELRIRIPVMQEPDGVCEECRGEKTEDGDPDLDECIRCGGTGKQYRFVHQQAYAISATLTVLLEKFMRLHGYRQADRPPLQLLDVNTMTMVGLHGSSLHGEFSGSLATWLAGIKDDAKLQPISEAMQSAYRVMFPFHSKQYRTSEFEVSVRRSGWLGLTCPGNGCCLTPNHAVAFASDHGYPFSSHNADAPYQQILFLIGLATLCDLARKEGVGR